MQKINNLYRNLPPGYHAIVEFFPEGFYKLGGNDHWWLKQDTKDGAQKYFTRVAAFTNQEDLPEDKTVLNMGYIQNSERVPRFSFNEVSKDGVTKG